MRCFSWPSSALCTSASGSLFEPRYGRNRRTNWTRDGVASDRARRTVEDAMWQPDGWGWRTRIGVLAAHLDIGTEPEFQAMAQAMAPAGVSLHSARVPLGVIGPDGVVVSRMSVES